MFQIREWLTDWYDIFRANHDFTTMIRFHTSLSNPHCIPSGGPMCSNWFHIHNLHHCNYSTAADPNLSHTCCWCYSRYVAYCNCEYALSPTSSPISLPVTAVNTSVRALVTGTANDSSADTHCISENCTPNIHLSVCSGCHAFTNSRKYHMKTIIKTLKSVLVTHCWTMFRSTSK